MLLLAKSGCWGVRVCVEKKFPTPAIILIVGSFEFSTLQHPGLKNSFLSISQKINDKRSLTKLFSGPDPIKIYFERNLLYAYWNCTFLLVKFGHMTGNNQ